jgi:CSLREA domain-containing protein
MSAIRYLLIFAIVFLPASPFATTFPVTKTTDTDDGICDPDCSLREAIGAANVNPGADDVPVPAGTYLLTLGELVVSDDVNIAGGDQASTIFDGNHSSRVLKIDSGAVVGIEGVTIQGGYASYLAGGILNGGDLTLTNSTVQSNRVWAGHYGHVGTGGGIRSSGALTLINSTVTGHWVAEYGGGIFAGGAVTLIDSTISGNGAFRGGGGIVSSGNLMLSNSTINRNYSYLLGGGILNDGDMKLTNSTVSGNWVQNDGGGIRNYGTMALHNSTVSENDAETGGGIKNTGIAALMGSIVAANSKSNCAGAINSLGNNLSDDNSCGLAAPDDLVVADAMLTPLADHGGPTQTHALLAGSPAIDAGSPVCPPPTADQRGVARPQGHTCDIGALEFVAAAALMEIDIQPGNDSNPIHSPGRRDLPVAILGSEIVDVREVDLTTLAFGPETAAPVHDLTQPNVLQNHLRDVNHDGFVDLLSHYGTQHTGISSDDLEACITGDLSIGARFEACDALLVISPNRRTLFSPATSFAVAPNPFSIAVADLDRDSVLDVVTANEPGDEVNVLLGNGDGSYRSAISFPTGASPRSVAAADLDGDEIPDLVTANAYSDDVSVLIGNGDGSFQAATSFMAGDVPISIAIADADGDTVLDLLAVNSVWDGGVSVLLGNGDGSFQAAVTSPAPARSYPRSIAVADLDGDNVPDVATDSGSGDLVLVLLGNGDGTFQAAISYPTGDGPLFVTAADLDGDSVTDLITANGNADDVSVLRGNGDGTFEAPVTYLAGQSPRAIAVADFDLDRVLDLAVTNWRSGDVSVLLGNGNGTFQEPVSFAVGDRPGAVAAADLDGNGSFDLVTANPGSDDVSVLLNTSRSGRTPQARRGRH